MRIWLALVAVALLAVHGHAQDSTNRVTVDRVEHEPSSLGGNRLRVYVSALSLLGGMLDLTAAKAVKLTAGGSEIKAPFALGRYAATDAQTAIVVVVQANLQYAEVQPVIADGLEAHVLAALDEAHTQLAVVAYGETVQAAKLAPIKTARAKLGQVQNDGTATDPLLLEGIERALALLKKAKGTPEGKSLRKIIVLIGDGHDLSNDRDRVTRLGERAAREGVRIHSLAFAPNDIRKPLPCSASCRRSRSSQRSAGPQAASPESCDVRFQQLRDEINQQYVLTYFFAADTTSAAASDQGRGIRRSSRRDESRSRGDVRRRDLEGRLLLRGARRARSPRPRWAAACSAGSS